MRIGFVIWGLCSSKGGIERVGVSLAHEMHARGHELVLFFHQTDPEQNIPMYPVDPAITIEPFTLGDAASVERTRELFIRHDLDVLCPMLSWDALLWFPAILNNTGIPLLISEHNNPEIIEQHRWNTYEHIACMAGADAIHVLAARYADFYPEFLRQRATVIGNPAPQARVVDWKRENAERKRLLAVGRLLDSHKRFALLIQAFTVLSESLPDWDLHICGDGKDRPLYEELIARCQLSSRIFLEGRVDDMDAAYGASHLFCIPSGYEGFPLVIAEAQAHGLPAVGFAQCSGTNEIIVHGENGILVDEMTPQALASGLRSLMKSPSLRRRMGERGQEMLRRYAAESIYDQWETLLHNTSTAKGHTRLNFPLPSAEEVAGIALQEILVRQNPFDRPMCTSLQRELRERDLVLGKAYTLLKEHGLIA